MTPAQTFEEFWRALGDRRWAAAATLIHPDEAHRLQQHDLALACAVFGLLDAKKRGESVNGAMSGGVLTPDLMERYRDRLVTTFPGGPSLAELAALTPTEFLTRSLAAVAAHRGDDPTQGRPRPQVDCLGTVEEGAELAHVAYRIRHADYSSSPASVFLATFRRAEEGWGFYPGRELSFSLSPPPPWPDEELDVPVSSRAAV